MAVRAPPPEPPKLPKGTAALLSAAAYHGPLEMRADKKVYPVGEPTPVGTGRQALDLVERGLLKIVRKDPFRFEITGPGRVADLQALRGKAGRP